MTYPQVVTLAIAIIGAVLGVLNTWRNFSTDRVKIRLSLKFATAVNAPGMPESMLVWEVVNLSNFPITIDEVGLHVSGSSARATPPVPILTDGGQWPRRLEARESVTVYGDLIDIQQYGPFRSAYVKTACGFEKKIRPDALCQLS